MAGMLLIQVLTGAMRALQDYVDELILPYINMKRKKIKLPSNHPALPLFDTFKAQCRETLLTHIDAHNVYAVLIPANCMDRLQPLDISVNKLAKDILHKQFQQWYSAKFATNFKE